MLRQRTLKAEGAARTVGLTGARKVGALDPCRNFVSIGDSPFSMSSFTMSFTRSCAFGGPSTMSLTGNSIYKKL